MNIFDKPFRKCLLLEHEYFIKRFGIYKLFLLGISFAQVIVISLGDVQAFFISKDSIIPKEWTFLKNQANARVISILFVVFIYLCLWITDNR